MDQLRQTMTALETIRVDPDKQTGNLTLSYPAVRWATRTIVSVSFNVVLSQQDHWRPCRANCVQAKADIQRCVTENSYLNTTYLVGSMLPIAIYDRLGHLQARKWQLELLSRTDIPEPQAELQ